MDFVEQLFGWAPDGGDGTFEMALLLTGGVGIFLFVLRDQLRRTISKK
jgi:hypothetical protein